MADWLDRIPDWQRQMAAAPLPRMQPAQTLWVQQRPSFAAQMAERRRLLAAQPDAVRATTPGSAAACAEALEIVLAQRPGAQRPDAPALDAIAQLISEDICILEKRGDEHVLTAALLCFPSSWTLAEKIGRPLTRIHRPVAPYTPDIARRVQRFFDAVQPGRPLWRANLLSYPTPELYAPRHEGEDKFRDRTPRFWRSELQTVARLPRTGAVIFAIHTTIEPA